MVQFSTPSVHSLQGTFPVAVAALLWGHRWATERVEFHLDNMAVVSVLSSGTSKDPNMMRFHRLAPHAAHVCGHTNSTISAGAASRDWTEKCQFYLANGLAPSTHQVYGSAQHQFLEFCSQDIPWDLSHPLLPASEKTLMHFCAHLADRLHHQVYLSAVRSLHIDYGYPDPLSTCLQLQRPLNAVKCNLTELTTRSTSLTSAVSGLACMRTYQDSSCSCATEHGIAWMVFLVSVSPECGDSLFDLRGQRFGMYAHVPGFFVLLRHRAWYRLDGVSGQHF